ncbi:cellulose biosynthesis protein BcsQ [Pseudomonas sp. BT76 TE3572]
MRVVSIVSTKDGVGKPTTTAANIGVLATNAGLSGLLMDLDIQPNLSGILELDERAPVGVHGLLVPPPRGLQQ